MVNVSGALYLPPKSFWKFTGLFLDGLGACIAIGGKISARSATTSCTGDYRNDGFGDGLTLFVRDERSSQSFMGRR